MIYGFCGNEKTVRELRIAYIGGGSRGWAWEFMQDLALEPTLSGEVRLYDIDREAAKKNAIIGTKIGESPKARAVWAYKTADSLREALTGADFVVISILPGTFQEMASDVHLPEKLGIYQSVGDTAGPGGMVRALRTIPMYVEIARAIRDYAPKAYVINYTNPMALCVRTLYHAFPGIRAFGCCHEIFSTQLMLCEMLREAGVANDVSREEVRLNIMGVNHFVWIDRASCRGRDIFPLFRPFAEKYRKTGRRTAHHDISIADYFRCDNRVKFDLFLRYGLIPAAGDRHLSEFLPPWYLRSPEDAKKWGFALTPVSWRVQDLNERLARCRRLVSGEEEVAVAPSGEEGVALIKALLGLKDLMTNVNLPNVGQIENLPLGAVVETNAWFDANGAHPLSAGALPDQVLPLVMPHALAQKTILSAALDCDRNLAFAAFMAEPLSAWVNPLDARDLCDQMIDNTLSFLPEPWRKTAARNAPFQ